MEFAKLSAPSLKDLFVQQLQGMILSDELPMGTQLPPERELAQQMQVSRAVVNGGLAELAQQGFLEVRPRQGTFVADYRRKGNLSTLIAIMEYQGGVLGKDEIRSIRMRGARWSIWLCAPSVMPRMKRWHAWGYGARRSAEQRAGG
ncbi:MAG: FadR/GntR family transcriptional regulator [Ruthenibacterium lactatiformans]